MGSRAERLAEALFYNGATVGERGALPGFSRTGDSMPDTRDRRSVEAAEQAAAAGDYATAEHLLREAARLQEASLGPLHPDLANTLNNLGVVCDITDKPADAERCYRRAYAIATAVLEPDHPFVATSGKNLRDFCKARGTPVESPTPPPAVAAEREPRATRAVPLPRTRPSHAASRLFASRRSSRLVAVGVLTACGLVFGMLTAARVWFSSNGQAGSSPGSAIQARSGRPAPTPVPDEPTPVPKETTANKSRPVGVRERRTTAASTPAPPTVADAHLCKDLSTGPSRSLPGQWHCDRASLPVDPGSLFFYTRLKSARDTTVQHRWYHGDHLRRVVELRIRASPTDGYRTYSRHTVDNLSGGDWRVELRTKDGMLLHEERFIVR